MQVALSLYVHLGKHLLLQVEAFVSLLLARLADGRNGATELQEVALEVCFDRSRSMGNEPWCLAQQTMLSLQMLLLSCSSFGLTALIWASSNACCFWLRPGGKSCSGLLQLIALRQIRLCCPHHGMVPDLTALTRRRTWAIHAAIDVQGLLDLCNQPGFVRECLHQPGLPHRAQQPV